MTQGLIWMAFGRKHNAHLVTSVSSARAHWDGPIAILCDEEKRSIVDRLAKIVDAQVVQFEPFRRSEHGSGAGYFNKTRLIELMPFSRSVFLDCDTLVVGDPSHVLPDSNEVRVTHFADWVTSGNKMRKRIEKWTEACPSEANLQLAYKYPAINTGVMGLSKLSKKLAERWFKTCAKNVSFMCDELAMQLIFIHYPHVVLPDYYNCSPVFSPGREGFDEEEVKIWHAHGFKSLRHGKGLSLWLPKILETLSDEDLRELWLEGASQEKYHRRFLEDPVKAAMNYAEKHQDEKVVESVERSAKSIAEALSS